MSNTIQKIEKSGGLTYQVRIPEGRPSASVIMLHGLGGDELSMWALDSALPKDALIVSPRGLFPLGVESYSWTMPSLKGWPSVHDFEPSVRAIELLIEELERDTRFDRDALILMGFSQGAALAFAAASKHHPAAVIAAAGFIPGGDLSGLRGLRVFWGHGTLDEWIPITRARLEVEQLREFGAHVDFCETEVGHKLGLECLQGLRKWLQIYIAGY